MYPGDTSKSNTIDEENDLAMLELLLKYGADPNILGTINGTDNPMILTAITWNRIEMVERLIQAGAYVNAHPNDSWKRTPLEYAIYSASHIVSLHASGLSTQDYPVQHPDMVKLLLDNGADPTARALGGQVTLIELAKMTMNTATTYSYNDDMYDVQGSDILPQPEIIHMLEKGSSR